MAEDNPSSNDSKKLQVVDRSDLKNSSMMSINLPANNFETFNFGKNAPPGYDKIGKSQKNATASNSIFKSIEYAKDTSKGSYRLFKRITALFFCSLTITVILLILMAIPVTMIAVGSIYVKNCSFQIMIPIWLIVFGALSIIKNLSTLIQRIKALNNGESNSSTVLNVFDSFMALFLIVWFLCGNYWVYHDRNLVQYSDPSNEETFCNSTTYLTAFWVITSIYIVIGAGILLFCCTVCFTIFIPTKK